MRVGLDLTVTIWPILSLVILSRSVNAPIKEKGICRRRKKTMGLFTRTGKFHITSDACVCVSSAEGESGLLPSIAHSFSPI